MARKSKEITKKMDVWDLQFIKLSVASFILFIVSFLPQNAIDFIVGWRWVWFGLFLLTSIKPFMRILK